MFFGKRRPEEEGAGAMSDHMKAAHGMPGVQKQVRLTPKMEQMLLMQKADQKLITEEDVHRAEGILEKYRQGKKPL